MANKKIYILGTAQLNIKNYGISVEKQKLTHKHFNKILEYAWDNGVKHYDTAINYNNEKILAEFIKYKRIQSKVNIITKLSFSKNDDVYKKTISLISNTFKSLDINKLHTLFIHNQNDFNIIKNKRNFFKKISKIFKIENLGFSVYDKEIADLILEYFPNAALQFPYNIVNNSFDYIKKKKGFFYARSIFLQGLLVSKKIKKNNIELYKRHREYINLLKKKKINPVKMCIDFVFKNKDINYIIFGVNNIYQLKEILNYKPKKKLTLNINEKIYKLFNNNFNDPRNW